MKFDPHEYQTYCIDYLLERPAAGLFLKPGMGKTVTALTAAERLLYDYFAVSKVLVIAPLRVAGGYLDPRERQVGPPAAPPCQPGVG